MQPPSHANILFLIATAASGHSQTRQLQKSRPIQGCSHHYDSPPGKDYVDMKEKDSGNSENPSKFPFYLISPTVWRLPEASSSKNNIKKWIETHF